MWSEVSMLAKVEAMPLSDNGLQDTFAPPKYLVFAEITREYIVSVWNSILLKKGTWDC